MNATIQKIKKKLADKRAELRKMAVALKENSGKLTPLFEDVEKLGGEVTFDGMWVYVTVLGDKHKFLAFARLVRKHGFELPKIDKDATGFTKVELLGDLCIYFQFSSTVCRRVKVGTKMVEQDVFETVCDEQMPYEPASIQTANDLPF